MSIAIAIRVGARARTQCSAIIVEGLGARGGRSSSGLHDHIRSTPSTSSSLSFALQQRQLFSSRSDQPKSSSNSGFSPLSWWQNRQETKSAEKYRERIERMSQKETWTVDDMATELKDIVTSWSAKLSQDKDTKVVKEMHKILQAIGKVLGPDATSDTVETAGRLQKLQAAVAGECTVEKINAGMKQFQVMALMHRVVRKRKLDGMPIPQTMESMQAIVQLEGPKLMSKAEKSRMMKIEQQKMKRTARR
jgi:hypothetical protein